MHSWQLITLNPKLKCGQSSLTCGPDNNAYVLNLKRGHNNLEKVIGNQSA